MLHQYEKLVLSALQGGAKTVEGLSQKTALGRDSVVKTLHWLKEKNAVMVAEEETVSYELGEEGKRFCAEGFPETRVLKKAAAGAVELSSLSREEMAVGFPWGKKLGWVAVASRDAKKFVEATEAGKNALACAYAPETACKKLASGGELRPEEMATLDALLSRGSIVAKKEKSEVRGVSITPHGKQLFEKEGAGDTTKAEVNALSREDIVSGKWKETRLRGYDTKTPVEKEYPAKAHPLKRVIKRIRGIFTEMGFEEMEGDMIVSSFWNFDALFQPQDHPARDLADTFYLTTPDSMEIPDKELARKVGKAHQKGWKYSWSAKAAQQPVLRTHTTAVSARYVAETGTGGKKSPAKYFTVGRVYRNEATDFKHLAEFHQVEGIIVSEGATFCDLLGLLREFYRKLGFDKIRFRPSFFPYTEPSLEIDVWYEPKKEWLELGGAGVFRPEVCLSLWGKYPVLAWGLSLERPTMIMMGIEDMRTFYKNDLTWLRETPASKAGLG